MGIRDFARILRPASPAANLDARAFTEAVRPHILSMIHLAARLGPRDDQDDIVQEALIRAWRHRARYDSRRGSLQAWLLTIVANEARRKARGGYRPIAVASRVEEPAMEERLDIDGGLARLTARQRLAIDCFYFADLSISETAAVMNCSEGTAKSTLADARKRLRRILEDG